MSAMTAAQLVAMTDKLAAFLLAFKPTRGTVTSSSTAGMGDGTITPGSGTDYGAHLKGNDLMTAILGFSDADRALNLLSQAKTLRDAATWQRVGAQLISPFINSLNNDIIQSSVPTASDINSFATYYNTGVGGNWTCLLAPDFAALYNGLFPTATIAMLNVYSPAIANMGSRAFGGSFSAGASVDTTQYGGAARCQVVVTSWAGASDTVTVTGTNQTGQTGRTWTATVAGNGSIALTPTVATDLLVSVSAITLPPLMTAGTIQVAGLIPAGRANPPV